MIRLALVLIWLALPAAAEVLVAARLIPAQHIITPADLVLRQGNLPGGVADPALLVGMEAKVAFYAGTAVRPGDVGLPATVDRNQIIPLVYAQGGLRIVTEGRALGRAAPGEVIRVMNLSSRNTVTARISTDGVAYVGAGMPGS